MKPFNGHGYPTCGEDGNLHFSEFDYANKESLMRRYTSELYAKSGHVKLLSSESMGIEEDKNSSNNDLRFQDTYITISGEERKKSKRFKKIEFD